MNKVNFNIACSTDVGNIKKVNEDSFIIKSSKIEKKQCALGVVCDGLGGLSFGDIASKMAIDKMDIWWEKTLPILLKNKSNDKDILNSLEKTINAINVSVIEMIDTQHVNMGTTMSCLLIIDTKYYIAHIGDSRVYKYDKELLQLTEDHTYYESLRKKGLIEQSKKVKKNILTQCIGSDTDIRIFTATDKIRKSCSFLVCSDGYYNKMNVERMKIKLNDKKIINSKNNYIKNICDDLVENVKSKGEKDNITLAVIRVDIKGMRKILNRIFSR